MRWVHLLIVVAGCADAVAPAAVQDPDPLDDLADADQPARADDAIAIAVAFYEQETGVQLPDVRVRWVAPRIPCGAGVCVGLTRSCDDILITWTGKLTLSQVPLAHEIAHCALLATNGDGDPQHVGSWWQPGGAVDRAYAALVAAGL